MDDSTRIFTIYFIALATALLIYVIYRIILNRKGEKITMFYKGFSMKFHYFAWFFIIPLWVISGVYDNIISQSLINVFPYSLIIFLLFLCVVLNVICFVGFFSFSKISWYCIEIATSIYLVLDTIVTLLSQNSAAFIISHLLVSYLLRLSVIIYYYKRKCLFFNSEVDNEKSFIVQDNSFESFNTFNEQKQFISAENIHNQIYRSFDKVKEVNNTGISFCRKCGTKLDADVKFCRKCGAKVGE